MAWGSARPAPLHCQDMTDAHSCPAGGSSPERDRDGDNLGRGRENEHEITGVRTEETAQRLKCWLLPACTRQLTLSVTLVGSDALFWSL